jgi:hypothetical protein
MRACAVCGKVQIWQRGDYKYIDIETIRMDEWELKLFNESVVVKQ